VAAKRAVYGRKLTFRLLPFPARGMQLHAVKQSALNPSNWLVEMKRKRSRVPFWIVIVVMFVLCGKVRGVGTEYFTVLVVMSV
jgi:hypothetical protein